MLKTIKNAIESAALEISTFVKAPSAAQTQCLLYVFGVTFLVCGMTQLSFASDGTFNFSYEDEAFGQIIAMLLQYIEGAFGALLMIVAGIGAIFAAALGSYKAALSLLIVAIGAFILRSLVVGFFGAEVIGDV